MLALDSAPLLKQCRMCSDSSRGGNARAALFDGLEEGGLRAGTSFSTSEIAEQENERGLDTLADRVSILKRVSQKKDIFCRRASFHQSLNDRRLSVEDRTHTLAQVWAGQLC